MARHAKNGAFDVLTVASGTINRLAAADVRYCVQEIPPATSITLEPVVTAVDTTSSGNVVLVIPTSTETGKIKLVAHSAGAPGNTVTLISTDAAPIVLEVGQVANLVNIV